MVVALFGENITYGYTHAQNSDAYSLSPSSRTIQGGATSVTEELSPMTDMQAQSRSAHANTNTHAHCPFQFPRNGSMCGTPWADHVSADGTRVEKLNHKLEGPKQTRNVHTSRLPIQNVAHFNQIMIRCYEGKISRTFPRNYQKINT